MENNRELPVSPWVDERLAILSPDSEWRPDTANGLSLFRELRDARGQRRWIWGAVAAAAGCLSLMALPAPRVLAERCLDYCSAALSETSTTLNPIQVNANPESAQQLTAEATTLLPRLDGTNVTLEQYRGKIVLVNFWATWCQPCNIEIPWLIEFNQKYGPRGLVILGVAMDEDGKQVIEPWMKSKTFDVDGHLALMNYQILIGDDKIAGKFGATIGLPTSFLYARDGKKIKTILGLFNHDDLQKAIESQL